MIIAADFFYITSVENHFGSHSRILPYIFSFYYHKTFQNYLQVDKLAFPADFSYNSRRISQRNKCEEREIEMRLEKVQDALRAKNIKYEYTEEDGCGSLDFMFRGLKFHVWEYYDNIWGAETNIYEAGRSQDIEGDYETEISEEILSWPDMISN